MMLEPLASAWRIVVLATAEQAVHCARTLDRVRDNSLSTDVSVLAEEDQGLRQTLSVYDGHVEWTLPAALSAPTFWARVLAASAPQDVPVLYLQAGCDVPVHWDARLVAASQRAKGAAVMSPMLTRHPLLGLDLHYEDDAGNGRGLDVDAIDQWVNDYARGVEFQVPALPHSCMLLQPGPWTGLVRNAEDDRELLYALRGAGLGVMATDSVYIDNRRVASDREMPQLPAALQDRSPQPTSLALMRHALVELSAREEQPPVLRSCLPVQLHVGHSWGGGLGRWMEDFIATDPHHHHLVLRSVGDLTAYGRTIGLYRSAQMDVPIQTWQLSEPVLSVGVASYEYREIIRELEEQYSVESLVVSSVIGHTLDLLRTSLPTTVVLHEFFPYCPALYATFDTPCQDCSAERLRECARDNPRHSYFRFDPDDYWLSVREAFLRALQDPAVTVVAPSQSVVARYRQLAPQLVGREMHVLPHGLDEQFARDLKGESRSPAARDSGRLRIVMLGRLTEEKGGDILDSIAGEVTQFADLWLLGTGESGQRFVDLPGVEIVSSYTPSQLGDLLRQVQPDLGMLLSTVPETFSYTLSELHAAAVPVLATRLGALAERIVEGENGWLVEPRAETVLQALRHLAVQRSEIDNAARRLAAAPVRTTADMVEDYRALERRPDVIPLSRYRLPRRSWRNPHTVAQAQEGGALYINPQHPYREALAEFVAHTERKTAQSPSLGPLRRALVLSVLALVKRLATRRGEG